MKEIRSKQSEFEIRTNPETQNPIVCGYSILFNMPEDLGDYIEQINDNAVSNDINAQDVSLLWSHKPEYPMASTRNGTLKLTKDDKGLFFEAELNNKLSYVSDVVENIKSGIVKGMSWGFRCTNDKWTGTRQKPLREIFSMEINEISAVLNPAFPQTSIFQMRSKDEILNNLPDENLQQTPNLLTDEEKAIKNKLLDLELI